jgi:hypothetical protein
MNNVLIRATVAAGMLSSFSSSATSQLSTDQQGALDAVKPSFEKVVSACENGGVHYLFSAVSGPGGNIGYIQFELWRHEDGRYYPEISYKTMSLNGTDQLNQIDARMKVDFYVKAYRSYEKGRWSNWTTGDSPSTDYVHFATFELQRERGLWGIVSAQVGIVQSPVQVEIAVSCADIPPL